MCHIWHTYDGIPARILKTVQFKHWYSSRTPRECARINARLEELAQGRFGDSRSLGKGLFELRWRSGLRVYYSRRRVGAVDVIVVWGGDKGSQESDIAKARRLKEVYERQIEEGWPQDPDSAASP